MKKNNISRILKSELRKNGDIVIPKNHPDNELSKEDKKLFSSMQKEANKLVKDGILKIVQDDRRIISFELI
jgi:hypothetical protein